MSHNDDSKIKLMIGAVLDTKYIDTWFLVNGGCNQECHAEECSATITTLRAQDFFMDCLSKNGYFSVECDNGRIFICFDKVSNSFGECTIVERSEFVDDMDKVNGLLGLPEKAPMNMCVLNFMQVNCKIKSRTGYF